MRALLYPALLSLLGHVSVQAQNVASSGAVAASASSAAASGAASGIAAVSASSAAATGPSAEPKLSVGQDEHGGLFEMVGRSEVQNFLSAPHIQPPKWKVDMYDRERLAPGFWFITPKHAARFKLGNTKPTGPWVGPHIFDDDGQLIWSGAHMFKNKAVIDFKPVHVNGKTLMAMQYLSEGKNYLLDTHYQIYKKITTGRRRHTLNTHEFTVVDNGTRFLYSQRYTAKVDKADAQKDIGVDWDCQTSYAAFVEEDAATGERTFMWKAREHVPLSDNNLEPPPTTHRCKPYWDFMHMNALDKFDDGHFLLSARHTDTLYKISKDDGSIIWRLHGIPGEFSDFEMKGLNFSRQHHCRIHENDANHAVISFLDNAKGGDTRTPLEAFSRALVVELRFDTTPMTAEIITSIDHPWKLYTFRRGSHQILPNGNSFVSWSEQGRQSEHAPDGTILSRARFVGDTLGNYRAIKYPFKGEPEYPPNLYSEASSDGDGTMTTVFASWNGATEVAEWVLYKTDPEGTKDKELDRQRRAGFETTLVHNGYAKHVYVQALDKYGSPLNYGKSDTIETIPVDELPSADLAAETAWLESSGNFNWEDIKDLAAVTPGKSMVGFFAAVIACIVGLYAFRKGWCRRKAKGWSYTAVQRDNDDDENEPFVLHDMEHKRTSVDESDRAWDAEDTDSSSFDKAR